jgi:ribA/ribD-fused uncharacterized protein
MRDNIIQIVGDIWPILEHKTTPYLRVFEKIGEEIGEWTEAKDKFDSDRTTRAALLSESADLIVTSISSPIAFSQTIDDLINTFNQEIQEGWAQPNLRFNPFRDDFSREFLKFLHHYGLLARKQRLWRKEPLKYQAEVIVDGIRLVECAVRLFLTIEPDPAMLMMVVTEKVDKWRSYDPPKKPLSLEEMDRYIQNSRMGKFSETVSTIDRFDTQWSFLSNFYMSEVHFKGKKYPSVEHAYQAAKVSDRIRHEEIRVAPTPGEAKILGRKYQDDHEFDGKKLEVMETLVRDKFTRSNYLRAMLHLTRQATLVEGNSWGDKFWGICDGEGANHLGKILMKIRNELCQK